ncbi:MAG: DUF1415 domain-containing protein [Proteobacteria bacterium]|nr:DUF1415 domain-containing protein [Pseudomonadota bacterium]
MNDAERAIAQTRAWVELAVVGLTLCPFAKAPFQHDLIRYVLCDSADPQAVLNALTDEMDRLVRTDPAVVETTLLILPNAPADFRAFNDFLEIADAALETAGHVGVLQIASFHPQYRFAGTRSRDLGNATNRSPHPVLHLLREASVDRAVAAIPDPATVYEANLRTLRALGSKGWAELQARVEERAAG